MTGYDVGGLKRPERRVERGLADFEPVASAFSKYSDVKRGRMFSSESVLSVNGKIFAMLTKGEFVVKVPADRASELVREGKGENWGPGTRKKMKEWIALRPGKVSWVDTSKEAYEYVKKPKA